MRGLPEALLFGEVQFAIGSDERSRPVEHQCRVMAAPCFHILNDCAADESDPNLASGLAHRSMTRAGRRFGLVILDQFAGWRPDIERKLRQHGEICSSGSRLLQHLAQLAGTPVGENHPDQSNI